MRILRPALGLCLTAILASPVLADMPKVGDKAADFTLKTPGGEPVQLAKLVEKGPVILVVLRGWPGYQCPICTKQVAELMGKSGEIEAAKTHVVLVYPGPSEGLEAHAEEFASGKTLPANFRFVVDPDYTFTTKYDLRWKAARETAYPSTFVIDSQGQIVYAKISKTHGDRAPISAVLGALKAAK